MSIEKFEHAGFTVEIDHDYDAENPHDDDMTPGCRLALAHGRYTLACDPELDFDQFSGWAAVGEYLKGTERPLVILPVYMIDHSGLAFRTGRDFADCDPGGWDSGQVGFAYVTRANWADTQGTPWTGSDEQREQAAKLITAEVEVYGWYVNGETYGYAVRDWDGEILDSCGGFYGFEAVEEAAKEAAEQASHDVKCTGELNRRTGSIEHGRACPVHQDAP